MPNPLLTFTERGIYCELADIYLDPWKPVDKAIITHGHADHARWGHKKYLTHKDNAPILKHRLGPIAVQGVTWGKVFNINGVKISLHPAGHIIGSSQIRVEYKGEIWVFTGDFKTEDDGIAKPYELIPCHGLITECTFGLPVFNWERQENVATEINDWWKVNKAEGKTSVLFCYTLGKAQRVMNLLDRSIGTIYTHGAIENMNEVLQSILELPPTRRITSETTRDELRGNMVIAPPSAHGSPWIRKLTPFVTGTASGWMAIRGTRRRRATDAGFVLSDHADWIGLLNTIKDSGAEKVVCTHGYTDVLVRYLNEVGIDASIEDTDFEGENLDAKEDDTISSTQS